LSRDTEDLAGLFKRLNHYGVEILTGEGKATAIHVGVRGIVGSMFLTDLANKVRRGYLGRVREGKVPGVISYGYRAIAGKPNEREIDPEQAAVVIRIFTEYAAGISPRLIALNLTRDGIPSPKGAAWSHQSFIGGGGKTGMLGNELYIGRLQWNRNHTVKDPDTGRCSPRANPEGDHLAVSVPHLHIIPQELWDAAQTVRNGRALRRGAEAGRRIVRRADHLMAGLLVCSKCHGSMILTSKSRGVQFVACAAARNTSACDHRKAYDLGKLERTVLQGFREHLTDPEAVKEAVTAYHERYQENEKKQNGERFAVEKKLNRITIAIERLVAAITDSDQPVGEIMDKIKPLEAERVGLRERLRLLKSATLVSMHPNVIETYKANVTEFHEALIGGKRGVQATAAFRNLVDSIVVHETAERAEYEVSVYGRLAAVMGIDLFPAMRSSEEILAEEGVTPCSANGKHTKVKCSVATLTDKSGPTCERPFLAASEALRCSPVFRIRSSHHCEENF
jgi:site-specific DNA recombinase